MFSCCWSPTTTRGEFAPRSSEGGVGWKRGGLGPPNHPADFRCGPAGLHVPTSPKGCGHRQVPGVSAGARGHRQVPGDIGRYHPAGASAGTRGHRQVAGQVGLVWGVKAGGVSPVPSRCGLRVTLMVLLSTQIQKLCDIPCYLAILLVCLSVSCLLIWQSHPLVYKLTKDDD